MSIIGAGTTNSTRRRGRPPDPKLIELDLRLIELARQYKPIGVLAVALDAKTEGES
jgi:hypothetical protein